MTYIAVDWHVLTTGGSGGCGAHGTDLHRAWGQRSGFPAPLSGYRYLCKYDHARRLVSMKRYSQRVVSECSRCQPICRSKLHRHRTRPPTSSAPLAVSLRHRTTHQGLTTGHRRRLPHLPYSDRKTRDPHREGRTTGSSRSSRR